MFRPTDMDPRTKGVIRQHSINLADDILLIFTWENKAWHFMRNFRQTLFPFLLEKKNKKKKKQESHDGPVTLTWATEHFENLI